LRLVTAKATRLVGLQGREERLALRTPCVQLNGSRSGR
jgi:hypothetical protein